MSTSFCCFLCILQLVHDVVIRGDTSRDSNVGNVVDEARQLLLKDVYDDSSILNVLRSKNVLTILLYCNKLIFHEGGNFRVQLYCV
jgi:hypothetical protein